MDKHIAMGVFVGGIFAATIASIAALDGLAAGGLYYWRPSSSA